MATNALNALMFGSENDTLYLGPRSTNLNSLTLTGSVPSGMEDVGWISEGGFELGIDDSTGSVKGHQGGGVVKEFMESSATSLTAVLLESKLKTFEWFFDTKGVKGTDSGLPGSKKDIGTFDIPAARGTIDLCGILDLFDTSNTETKTRLIIPHLTLGARESVAFKIGEITAYKMPLQIIGGFKLITNHPALVPSA